MLNQLLRDGTRKPLTSRRTILKDYVRIPIRRSLPFVSPLNANAFLGNEDLIADSEAVSFSKEAIHGFM